MGATEVRKWSSPADKPSACLATDAIHWQMGSMTTAPKMTSRCIGFWPSPLCSRRGISSQWIDLSHRAQGQETSEWPWRSHARRRRAWTQMMRPNEWSRRGCRNHDAPTAARRFPTKCLLRLQLPQSHWQAQGCSSNLAPQALYSWLPLASKPATPQTIHPSEGSRSQTPASVKCSWPVPTSPRPGERQWGWGSLIHASLILWTVWRSPATSCQDR